MFKMKKQFELNNSTVFLGECSEAGEDYEKLDESFSEQLRSEQERGHLLISQLALCQEETERYEEDLSLVTSIDGFIKIN